MGILKAKRQSRNTYQCANRLDADRGPEAQKKSWTRSELSPEWEAFRLHGKQHNSLFQVSCWVLRGVGSEAIR